MSIEVLKEQEVPLLSRKRYTLEVDSPKQTMSRKELVKLVAEKIKSKPELVVVKHIYTRYGSRKSKVIAHSYKDKKDMERIEEGYLLKKNSLEEPKSEEESAA